MERKRLQVVHAPHKSPQAKLVKLADKLYNLRDLDRVLPEWVKNSNFSVKSTKIMFWFRSWSEERAQEYFVWASYVLHGLQGSNKILESKLDEILATRGVKVSLPPKEVTEKWNFVKSLRWFDQCYGFSLTNKACNKCVFLCTQVVFFTFISITVIFIDKNRTKNTQKIISSVLSKSLCK